ncbi:MAG TPA: arginine decarboxylase, partial [Nitrospiria bacterium]|nr:arginine decarboxylase [Nitrospiria bacterium]
LPPSAVQLGADLVVQSTHKIIGGMTQASMLHARSGRVDLPMLANVLRFIQTTSPSYILMASLDLARMQMATEGTKLLGKAIKLAMESRGKIQKIEGLSCYGDAELGIYDQTKLTIGVADLGLSGYEVSRVLNNRFGIQVEMADPFHILVIVSIGDRRDDLARLVAALREIARENLGTSKRVEVPDLSFLNLENQSVITPRKAFFADPEYIPLDSAVERVSSEIVTVYPPGIPVLVPGERISRYSIDYLKRSIVLGGTVDGLDETNRYIGVVKN